MIYLLEMVSLHSHVKQPEGNIIQLTSSADVRWRSFESPTSLPCLPQSCAVGKLHRSSASAVVLDFLTNKYWVGDEDSLINNSQFLKFKGGLHSLRVICRDTQLIVRVY